MCYEPVIGLEIHAELLTDRKIFCGCENRFAGRANTRVCAVCTGQPGALPRLNRQAVELGVRAGLALGCEIQPVSGFDRKNYCYPDLPKAYQITQFFHPLCLGGGIDLPDGFVRIERIHLEEDAGKLLHDQDETRTLVDLNRSGVPLIEIVTKPDLHSAAQAKRFVEEAARRLQYAGVCDCKMQQGSLRVDVNISVRRKGEQRLGVRAEIKNLNSYKAVVGAIEYETRRQSELLRGGGLVLQQTRRYDDSSGITLPMRDKAETQDYRYFPEPDLPVLTLRQEDIARIAQKLPRMPQQRREQYRDAFGLPDADIAVLLSQRELADFYEEAAAASGLPKETANFVIMDLLKALRLRGKTVVDANITPAQAATLVGMYCGNDARITHAGAAQILDILLDEGGQPEEIAREKGYLLIRDRTVFENAAREVIAENPRPVRQYRDGSGKVFGFLLGRMAAKLGKSFDAKLAAETLKKLL
ncbi:Asp-tRNA(Asn)/Glu-tRNA(Gln) amidotransferase subunit GatB [Candidatus Soleaferrea massiliensis]|uniref:Asp-tRNA(Asn)/Glu-tRNA(Gln) amidotransferase subunit GatB n=1 Tax=Candidatus Soleaferrea massiliensis TaxID=1470354 RepID=UPI00058C03D6|nr:Asp-tRNA(Asn)/Glu-tRNA(Gln) amidotransferase subunit GatB [Candidatus Soleaferrea massiliensis]